MQPFHQRPLSTGISRLKPILPTLVVLFLSQVGIYSAHAATRIWTGGHASGANWNLRDNWGGVGIPTHGDIVVFPSGAARTINTNNIAGLRLQEIQFLGLGGGYNVRGQSLTVSNGIRIAADAANTLSVTSITLHGSQSIGVAAGGTLVVSSDLVLSNGNLTLSADGDMSLRCSIGGSGDVIKDGPGLVTYFGEADNTYRGTTVVSEGTLALYQRETISIVPLTVVSRIAVPGNLVVGNGTNAAMVRLNHDGQIVNTATVTVLENAELKFFNNHDAFTDLILRGGKVTMDGGMLVLNGDITSVANPIGSGIGGQILLNSDAAFDVEDGSAAVDLELSANIGSTGGHGFTKAGTGTLRLNGTNTYLGPTIVSSGTIRLGSDKALGASSGGTTVEPGGEIVIDTVVETLREPMVIAGTGTNATSGAIRIGSAATIATNITLSAPATILTMSGGNLTIEGVISGTGPLTKIGPGTLELGGKSPNDFSGNVLAKEGLLLLSKTLGASVPADLVVGTPATTAIARNTRSGNVGGAVTVNAGSLYDLNDNNESVDGLTLIGGGDVRTGTGELTLDGDVNVSGDGGFGGTTSTIDGRIRLTNTRYFTVAETGGLLGDGVDLTVNAHIRGLAGIIKDGTGDLSLTASNSFTGAMQVDDGEVLLLNGHALGGGGGGEVILNGDSVLVVSGGIEVTNRLLIINSTGPASGGPFQSRTGTNLWSDGLSLGYESTIIQTATNSVLEVSGAIWGSQGGLTKTGPGVLVLSGGASNRYAGTTRVLEGTLRLEHHTWPDRAIPGPLIIGDGVGIDLVENRTGLSQINDDSEVTISDSGWLVLQSVSDERIGSLAGNGHVHFVGAGAGLDIGVNGASSTFAGEISGNGSLTKSGTGTLILTGTNTYNGDTLVGEGTLIVNGEQPGSDIYVAPGATLRGKGEVGNVAVDGTLAPGDPAGRFTVATLNFLPGGIFDVDLNGTSLNVGHSMVDSHGPVDLTGAILNLSLGFAPKTGDYFFLCTSGPGDDLTGNFAGVPEGAVLVREHIPLHVTYEGNVGNSSKSFFLSVGELPLRLESARVEAGNGNGIIDRNECDHLYVAIENPTAAPVTVVSAYLQSLDDQVAVTQSEGDYALVPAMSARTNRAPFQIRTAANYHCGKNARFNLVVDTVAHGKFSIPMAFSTGKPGSAMTFHGTNLPLAIPDNNDTASLISITNRFRVATVRVSVHVTHPSAGQLRIRLSGPPDYTESALITSVNLIDSRGGAGDNLGAECQSRTTFDDDAAGNLAASAAPFAGEFHPEESLSDFVGVSSEGIWALVIEDTAPGGVGTLQCWSLELFPAECDEGGGGCASCMASVSGAIDNFSPSMPQKLSRLNPASGCGDNPPCAGAISGVTAPYRYAAHSFTNTGPDACITAVVSTPCTENSYDNVLVGSAYLGGFDPADLCANLLGASHDDYYVGSAGFGGFSFPVPAGERFTVVINEQNTHHQLEGCGSYTLELYGLPCPQEQPTLHIANDAGPDNVRLHWSTAYPGFQLQGTPNLGGLGLFAFTNVIASPVVIDGNYSVTNRHGQKGDGFFRLRKP